MNISKMAKKAAARDLRDPGALEDYFQCLRLLERENPQEAHRQNRALRRLALQYAKEQNSSRMLELHRRGLLFDAPGDFDAYCKYIEWEREKPFYLPRRKQLFPIAQKLQRLADGELELLAISLPPGVGKTTLAIFFLTFLGGRNPERPILGSSHSKLIMRGIYDECLRIMDPKGEYLFRDVFPQVKIVKTNADDLFLDLESRKRFPSLQFRSIDSENAGVVRAEQLLYCDDLCSGIEEAMSRDRMDTLWTKYSTDLRQRKIGDCKELHIATRWSVHDVIGRLERDSENENGKAEFVAVPALDEQEESNFDYKNAPGFSTKFYLAQRELMDEASWRALYMNQPIEREGQLYSEDELRYYFQLPEEEPDAVLAVCDTKDKGSDYCFMPVVYKYGTDFYLDACVYDNGSPEAVEAQLVKLLLERRVQMCQFESNAAGGRIAQNVQKEVRQRGGVTKITTKFTTANKETKIIVNSPFVKQNVLFRHKSSLGREEKQYRRMLQDLCGYTMAGKNKHDDAPDGMALLALYVQRFGSGGVQVFQRPI